jgi:hypothetical protein
MDNLKPTHKSHTVGPYYIRTTNYPGNHVLWPMYGLTIERRPNKEITIDMWVGKQLLTATIKKAPK